MERLCNKNAEVYVRSLRTISRNEYLQHGNKSAKINVLYPQTDICNVE